MEPYGAEFRRYFVESTQFYEKERKKEPWLALGTLVQALLVLAGLWFLPAVHLQIWLYTMIASLVLTLWGLAGVWWEQRKYSSYDRWQKHVRDRGQSLPQVSN